MAARGRRKGTPEKIVGGFVAVPKHMVASTAWRTLQGSSVKIWIELSSRFNGSNNGGLSLSYDEAARLLSMSKSTVKRAFEELVERGFLAMVEEGFWRGRKATTWRLTWKRHGTHPATNEWQTWSPQAEPGKTERRYSNGTKPHA